MNVWVFKSQPDVMNTAIFHCHVHFPYILTSLELVCILQLIVCYNFISNLIFLSDSTKIIAYITVFGILGSMKYGILIAETIVD